MPPVLRARGSGARWRLDSRSERGRSVAPKFALGAMGLLRSPPASGAVALLRSLGAKGEPWMLQIWAAPRALRTIGRGFENASGLGFWTSHPLHHAHMVNRQSHVRPEPCEARARRARAKNRMRKAGNHEPTASQMVFVGTRFSIGLQMQPGKSSRTTGQLSGPIFPATFVVRWKNAFPQKPFGRPWAHGSPLCACSSSLGLFGLGLFGLWPHMALASHGSGLTWLWRLTTCA
jgi:hypothetical protein